MRMAYAADAYFNRTLFVGGHEQHVTSACVLRGMKHRCRLHCCAAALLCGVLGRVGCWLFASSAAATHLNMLIIRVGLLN